MVLYIGTAVKCRFFAQYWGVKCFQWKPENSVGLQIQKVNYQIGKYYDCGFLLLKPLSKITDKDAIEISKIFGWNHYSDEGKIHQVKNFVIDCSNYHSSNISSNENFNLIDFLRSKGYAVPFMEYSVDELVALGWVQLS